MANLAEFFLELETFQAKVVEKVRTHFVFNKFLPENHLFYEVIWKNLIEPDRPQMTIIRRMRFACWITKDTDSHSEYVTLIAFSRQQWLRERASMLRCAYIACFVTILSVCACT
jgi:hypothetical protein